MEKRTKKNNLSNKKSRKERVLNYMMELKANPSKVLEESERLIRLVMSVKQIQIII